jgi:hypothetical protein
MRGTMDEPGGYNLVFSRNVLSPSVLCDNSGFYVLHSSLCRNTRAAYPAGARVLIAFRMIGRYTFTFQPCTG